MESDNLIFGYVHTDNDIHNKAVSICRLLRKSLKLAHQICVVCILLGSHNMANASNLDPNEILSTIQEHRAKVRNFHLRISSLDHKYTYDEVKQEYIPFEEIKYESEILSQEGKFIQRYNIDSSLREGLHIEQASSTFFSTVPNLWIRHDLGSSNKMKENKTTPIGGIAEGALFDSAKMGILDAHLGSFGQYDFHNFPSSIWFKEESLNFLRAESAPNGDIKLIYDPGDKSDKTIFSINPHRGPFVYQLEHFDPEWRILEKSLVLEFETKDGLQVPKRLNYTKYTYIKEGIQQTTRQREIQVETLSLSPEFPDSSFRLDFKGARVYDSIIGMELLMQGGLDYFILDALESSVVENDLSIPEAKSHESNQELKGLTSIADNPELSSEVPAPVETKVKSVDIQKDKLNSQTGTANKSESPKAILIIYVIISGILLLSLVFYGRKKLRVLLKTNKNK